MTELAVALLLSIAPGALAMRMPCPPFMSQNLIVGASGTWTGEIGGRPITCDICAFVLSIGMSAGATVEGRCRAKHFGRRRLLTISFFKSGGGTLCRPALRVARATKCVPGPSGFMCPLPPPLPRRCCALAVPAVTFDAVHPPVTVSGSFACPKESGTFTLRAE